MSHVSLAINSRERVEPGGVARNRRRGVLRVPQKPGAGRPHTAGACVSYPTPTAEAKILRLEAVGQSHTAARRATWSASVGRRASQKPFFWWEPSSLHGEEQYGTQVTGSGVCSDGEADEPTRLVAAAGLDPGSPWAGPDLLLSQQEPRNPCFVRTPTLFESPRVAVG